MSTEKKTNVACIAIAALCDTNFTSDSPKNRGHFFAFVTATVSAADTIRKFVGVWIEQASCPAATDTASFRIERIFVRVRYCSDMTARRLLRLALLASATLRVCAQVAAVTLPDTSLDRGTVAVLPIAVETAAAAGDTLDVRLVYSRAALAIGDLAAKFPNDARTIAATDETLPTGDGQYTVRLVCLRSVTRLELVARCTTLWSGSSPARFSDVAIYRNSRPLAVRSDGGTITLDPTLPLVVEPSNAIGPIAPHPIEGDRFRVTFWLAGSDEPTLLLYDPLGRELMQWTWGRLPAGPHTVELTLDRNATSAGMYHLCLRVNGHVLIAPCIIAK
jgi:hypothetical protein